ncbi:MAG: putative ABC transporter permease [Candidatus Dojkabacteria bacterium]|jgi:uncharacterized membrane protein
MIVYILIFILFSFLGWIIDTTYSSIFIHKKFQPSGYYKNIPLCPIYGIGGIIIFQIFSKLINYDAVVVILVTTIFVIALEYLGGVFCVRFLNERLWDYSNRKFNLHGHIDLLDSFFWLVLIALLYFLTTPYYDDIARVISSVREKTIAYDIYASILFIIVLLALTIRTKEKRLSKKKQKTEVKNC